MRDYNYIVNKKKYLIQKEIYESFFLKEDKEQDANERYTKAMGITKSGGEQIPNLLDELGKLKNTYRDLEKDPRDAEETVRFFENLKKAGIEYESLNPKAIEDLFDKYKENENIETKDVVKAFGDGIKKILGGVGDKTKEFGASIKQGFKG